jgi:hypothetical protein
MDKSPNRNMLVLFDPGLTLTWISSNKLLEGTKGNEAPSLIGMTISGQFNSNKTVELTNLCFPEFYRTRYFSSYKARVFETSCHYDMIIGRNMLQAMGLIVDFKDNLMTWDDVVVAMKMYSKKPPLPNEPSIVSQMILNLVKDDLITTDNVSQVTFYSQNTSCQMFDKLLKDRNSLRHHSTMS